MDQLIECMCTECGVSLFLDPQGFFGDDVDFFGKQLLSTTFCSECGGRLLIVGKVGDEPNYRLA